ncbi:hypothetical protein D3C81_1009370 [compost metagenome]
MGVEVEHFALEAGEGDDVQLVQLQPAFPIVVRFLAQGRRQAPQQFSGADPSRACLAPHQLRQGERAAAALQLFAPLIIEPAPFIEHEEHFEGGIAKQHVRRLLACRAEVFGAVRDVQPLQQALAHPTLTLPFACIGEKGVGLFGLDG